MRWSPPATVGGIMLLSVGVLIPTAGAVTAKTAPTSRIPAVLAAKCVACHGSMAKGGLRLDSIDGILRGGDSGPAKPTANLPGTILSRVASDDPKLRMPPSGARLSAAEIQQLREWLGELAGNGSSTGRDHWAFRPIQRPAVPVTIRNARVRTPVDAFILDRLAKEKLRPSPEADRYTLLRRLALDLTGLPPTELEIREFVGDTRPDAYERCVDRLLASPHFGERWGRHWLDLARYADSDGYEKDSPRPFAYLYRDWVIDAINRDLPFDQFTVHQLAGDLLPNAGAPERTALGFHRNTLKNREGGIDPEEDRVKNVVDRVNTTGTVWLGLTLGCAQCHSHKYDPISIQEYYSLYWFWNRAVEQDSPAPAPSDKDRKIPTLVENPSPPKTRILLRGDFLNPGAEVGPGVPSVLPSLSPTGIPSRLDLAHWLTDRRNPLTARVQVNRVWQHLFGRGLVGTPDDFGTRGERPSHPELLDWLADRYSAPRDPADQGLGWSLKSLIRLLVTSSTYRQSSRVNPALQERDPKNLLLSRQNRFRPEAEVVRDLALAASGLLNRKIGGPSIRPPLPADIAALGYAGSIKWPESVGEERLRRGMYIFYQRTVPYPMLANFDAPDSNSACTRRERSNTPLQALNLLNDPAFWEAARKLGLAIASSSSDEPTGVHRLFLAALNRPPTPAEVARIRRQLSETRSVLPRSPGSAEKIAGSADPHPAAWVLAARSVLNLDEFLVRD